MSALSTERHQSERGMILKLLIEDQAERTTFRSLHNMLALAGRPMSPDSLTFHLARYLEPAGYVRLWRTKDVPLLAELDTSKHPDAVEFVAILPLGIQAVNRTVQDPEVRF